MSTPSDELTPRRTTDPAPPAPRRWAALVVLCVGFFMIVLDTTVVNVALPAIQDDLAFSQSGLAWVVNAYLVPFGGLLLLAGRLGDLAGQRRVFLSGVVLFTVASVGCGLAQTQEALVVGRFVQGVGGALTSAVVLGMIVRMFPEPGEQARAIGVYGFVASGGGSVGLLAGGVLTQAINWHWIFFINVPIGIAIGLLALRLVPGDRGLGLREGADVPGAVLITSGLMLGVYTIVGAAEHGWTSGRTLGLGAVSAALLTAFVVRQARVEKPLLPLRLFRSRNVSGANLAQALTIAGMFALFFLGALYLERILGYDAVGVGIAFLPATLVMGVLSVRFSAPLAGRFGPRAVVLAGLGCVGAAVLLFARVPVDGSYVTDVLPSMVLLGMGAGTAFPALMMLAMSGVSPADSGLASGLVNTTAQVGAAVGLAVLATVAAGRTESGLAAGAPPEVALTDGFAVALLTGAGLVAVAIAAAAAMLRTPAAPEHEDASGRPDPANEVAAPVPQAAYEPA